MSNPLDNVIEFAREQWLERRFSTVGASDVPTVLGVNPYKSKVELWAEKTGKVEPPEQNRRMRVGLYMEALLAVFYEEETGNVPVNLGEYAVIEHPDLKGFQCTPDCIVLDGATSEPTGVVEFKTTSNFEAAARWRESKPPLQNQVQLQAQLAITGLSWGDLACLVQNEDFLAVRCDVHADFIGQMLERVDRFLWHVRNDVMPDTDGSESTRHTLQRMFPEDDGAAIQMEGNLLQSFEVAKEVVKRAEAKESRLKNQVIAALGSASYALDAEGVTYSYKKQTRKGAIKVELNDANIEKLTAAGVKFDITPESSHRRLIRIKQIPEGVEWLPAPDETKQLEAVETA